MFKTSEEYKYNEKCAEMKSSTTPGNNEKYHSRKGLKKNKNKNEN